MSASSSWTKLDQTYTDDAMKIVRQCMSVMRGRGHTVGSAYFNLADHLKINPRRVRTLFKNDGIPVVKKPEFRRLRERAGDLCLEEAARLRELAKTYHENNL